MELIYNVTKSSKFGRDWARDEATICCLSSKNVIAFSSTLVLNGDSLDKPETSSNSVRTKQTKRAAAWEVVYHLYVCDISKPWEVFHLTSYPDRVLRLDWQISGSRLLVATAKGRCQVWEMKEHLLNQWECSYNGEIAGEEIVALGWLHPGQRMTFNAEYRESALYSEKIQRARFFPTLSHFGGAPTAGWVAVTTTSLVSVGMVKASKKEMLVQSESLMSGRSRILVADIAYDSSGDILVVTSDGNIASPIQCYRVKIKPELGSCTISCKPTASFYAKCHMDGALRDSSTSRITHVKFMSKETGDILIVGAGDLTSSHVELWNQHNETVALHRVYQAAASPDSSHKTHKWVHQSSITYGSLPVSIAVPQFPVTYIDKPSTMFQYVAVAYKDGSVKLVNKSNFQPMATMILDTGICESDKGEKRRRVVPYMADMQQTFTGCGLVGIDQYSCVYVMKMLNTRDPVTQVSPVYLVGMLEYLMMTGLDWWDVLTALRPGVVENVIQKMMDNFKKQPAVSQEILYSRFMAIRATLFRCSSSSAGQQRAADCHCKLVLHSVAALFKSIIRPKAVSSSQEKSPAEKLTLVCSKNTDFDIGKVMMSLSRENKEYVVDVQTLQALQQLVQWVADLTLHLLASLPLSQGYSGFTGSSLLRDAGVLATLRELLVLIRMWGLINSSCLPHFTTTVTSFDCLSQLFKLLTKVWLVCKDGKGANDFEESLVDECCLLPSQVMVPSADQGLFGNMDYDSSILMQSHPIKYNFGEVPSHASHTASQSMSGDGQRLPWQLKDIIRQINLGVSPPERVKMCSRCDCASLLKSISKSAAVRAWELRWTKACMCGGHWRLTSS